MVYATQMADPHLKDESPFRHYSLKYRLTAWISMHLFHSRSTRCATVC
jgi:hypothetical protein